MKIEIELLDIDIPYSAQFEAVDKYIKNNTVKVEEFNYFGETPRGRGDLVLYTKKIIAETKNNCGYRIELERYRFHVSCKKTKGGTYKFKVWQAI